ncbi:hypothetical protein [Caproiciproducens galactitolivorans]|uniref:Uncharacterized protein n=1 Tax=Caproiciproducens galactitolivorans TaxID=642589 RepID=A0ABT4BQX3_9FIRM|nr:hypothetical protein [Caproiciproducens galactitolivorans]MCY1713277.1 hypothetical protein [Caproiciproducens galactitolivorans]
MNHKHKSRLFLCLLFLYIAILPVTAALTGFAENYPEIDTIDYSLYLSGKYQFFHRPDGGFALISSDGNLKSMASLLDRDGNSDSSCATPSQYLNYVYENTSLYGDSLYLIGMERNSDSNAVVSRLNLKTGKLIHNRILGCTFDFTRDFRAEADGEFSLVIAPIGQEIDDDTKASIFHFDETVNNGMITPEKPKPESSESPGSAASEPPSSSSASSDPAADLPASIEPYRFEKPVTVEALQAALDANKKGEKIRVLSSENKKEITSGPVGTGRIIQTIANGKTETVYIAVIPGDLDGSGTVTDYDYRLLCDYFTQAAAGGTPVLSGPYLEAASLSGGKQPETGDLLKIKRLSKQVDD